MGFVKEEAMISLIENICVEQMMKAAFAGIVVYGF